MKKNSLKIKSLAKGIIFSIIITFILILIVTCICYWGNVSEKVLGVMLFGISCVSVFLSSILLGKSVKEKGLVYGILNGFGYFIVILASAVCFSGKFNPSAQSISMLMGSVFSGALGGIIGVNK